MHLHSLHLLDTRSVYSNKVEKENASLKQRKSGNFFSFLNYSTPLFFSFFPFLWSPGQQRGCNNTAVVTRSLVSLPTECCPRLHHSQKLCFNIPPSGFITGTPSGEPQERLPAPSGSEISNAETKLVQSFLPALPWLWLWRGLVAQGKPPFPRPPDSIPGAL